MKKAFCCIFCIINCFITGVAPGNTIRQTTATIRFRHWVGNKELTLFDETYTNQFGEPFVVSKFRYYVSNITVTTADGKEMKPDNSCFLVNEADSVSKVIQIPVVSAIQSISFVIGVDSIRNVGGVQTGSLDPANGMFWTWNSGYVFAKLEGQSDASHAAAHSFTWDVGGFRQGMNALRKITLAVKNNGSAMQKIIINADILQWFNAVHPLKISQSPTCHQPGKLAMQLADNYKEMFSVAP